MPKGQGETPRQGLRVDPELWGEFAAAVRRAEPSSERPEILRQFMRWYTWQPGAKRPERPKRDADAPSL